ncbi:hypothetical protein HZS55_12135 [Halosimplex rubrum]|uniref:Restriction endonuclease n=1 Tax=Halosimplex rubrum TaxID=869889 RepID=A0A7D5P5N5_9EURY|nr:hypothetical protein [Halosimplex rubrum]QLH78002.1 hypothetical protein HZS55_12135 [Halosimplex rubrum]
MKYEIQLTDEIRNRAVERAAGRDLGEYGGEDIGRTEQEQTKDTVVGYVGEELVFKLLSEFPKIRRIEIVDEKEDTESDIRVFLEEVDEPFLIDVKARKMWELKTPSDPDILHRVKESKPYLGSDIFVQVQLFEDENGNVNRGIVIGFVTASDFKNADEFFFGSGFKLLREFSDLRPMRDILKAGYKEMKYRDEIGNRCMMGEMITSEFSGLSIRELDSNHDPSQCDCNLTEEGYKNN